VQKSRLKRRRLKWYIYDDYDDSPASEYLDIPPKIITQPPIKQQINQDPDDFVFTQSVSSKKKILNKKMKKK